MLFYEESCDIHLKIRKKFRNLSLKIQIFIIEISKKNLNINGYLIEEEFFSKWFQARVNILFNRRRKRNYRESLITIRIETTLSRRVELLQPLRTRLIFMWPDRPAYTIRHAKLAPVAQNLNVVGIAAALSL